MTELSRYDVDNTNSTRTSHENSKTLGFRMSFRVSHIRVERIRTENTRVEYIFIFRFE